LRIQEAEPGIPANPVSLRVVLLSAGLGFFASIFPIAGIIFILPGFSTIIRTAPLQGLILKTTNGGTNWARQTLGATRSLQSVHFPADAQTGYAVGDSGLIFKTANGGTNWAVQISGTTRNLRSVHFPVDAQIGYAVGGIGTILKYDEGSSFVEQEPIVKMDGRAAGGLKACPNPFVSFAVIPAHESERFTLYDITGRKVGTFKGNRIGQGLSPGVYFLRQENGAAKALRIVKLR